MPRLVKITPGEFDPEMIPVLEELNKIGIKTIGSCCGHGGLGYIAIDIKSLIHLWVSKDMIVLYFDSFKKEK